MQNEKEIVERARKLAVAIVSFAKELPQTPVYIVLTKQLVRAGTSIGANVAEAQDAVSRKEFIPKISIAIKEARETLYWFAIIIDAEVVTGDAAEKLRREVDEVLRVLITIVKNTKNKVCF